MLQDAARCCKLQMLQDAPRLIVLQRDGDHETASDVQIVQELAVTCWICCLNWNPWNRLEPLVRNLPQTGSEHNQTCQRLSAFAWNPPQTFPNHRDLEIV